MDNGAICGRGGGAQQQRAGSSFHVLLASRTPAGAVAASTTTSSKIDCDGDDDLWVGRLPFATKAANKW